MKHFISTLKPLRRKLFAEMCINYILIGISAGQGICIAMILAAKLVYVRNLYMLAALIIICAMVAALAAALFKSPSYHAVAAAGDALGFKERFVTAFELFSENRNGAIDELAMADALKRASENNLAKLYKIKINRKHVFVLLALCAAMPIVGFIPSPMDNELAAREMLNRKIAEEIVMLNQVKDEITTELTSSEAKKLDDAVKKLTAELRNSKTEGEALRAAQKTQEELKKLAKNSVNKDLKALGEKLSSYNITSELGESLQNGNIDKLADQLHSLADFFQKASQQELDAFSEMLVEAANELSENSELSEALNEWANVLASGALDNLDSALQRSSEEIAKAADENASFREAVEKFNDALSGNKSPSTQNSQNSQSSGNNQSQSGQNQEQGDQGQNQEQGNQGQGNQGQEQGQGNQGQGQGQGNQDQGQGQGNQGQGQGQGNQGQGSGSPGNQPGPGRGSGHVENENIYRREAEGFLEYSTEVQGTQNENGSVNERELSTIGSAGSSVPYSSVLNEYRDEALRTLEDYSIPHGLKEIVKQYFSSLE